MAIKFNESDIGAEAFGGNARRQRLLTAARVPNTKVLLDRITLDAGAIIDLTVPAGSVAWFQMLEGEAVLRRRQDDKRLSASHVVFLPPAFSATLACAANAALLYAEIPHAVSHDADFAVRTPQFRVVDWKCEPVLDSEHDARKRIYLVTPKLFATKVLKGEMIIYPPGTQASNHHHEGAEHFMYVTQGRGTAFANEAPLPVRKGDLIYYADRERHYLRSEGEEDMIFVEFFVPGEYKTVWVPGAPVCTWSPTGRDIRGETPSRQIKKHSSALAQTPQDI
jgi:quercetin dioxygenase-like cupin family protein